MASDNPRNVSKMFSVTKIVYPDEEIATVKLNLMSCDSTSQMIAVSWILKNLNILSNTECENLIEILIATDVVTYLCKAIACSHGQAFISMLDILDKLRFSDNFYKCRHAKNAVDSILCVAFIMVKKIAVHEESLSVIAYTLYVVLDGASRAQVSLDQICNLNRMILFVKNLNPGYSSKYVLRMSAAKLLCLVMENIRLGSNEEIKSSLFTAFTESLLSIGSMVVEQKDSNDLNILQTSMAIIISTCAIGIRFSKEFRGEDFMKEIRKVVFKIVIPHFKTINFGINKFEAITMNFVDCLDDICQLKNYNKDLEHVLAKNGYLNYFFLLMSYPSLRKPISSLVSKLIANLSEDDLSSGDCTEALAEFRNYLYQGMLSLPSTTEHLNAYFVLETVGAASDTLLVLLYHHCQKTQENNLVPLSSLILKAVTLSGVQWIPVLKATWFFIAVSSLKHSAVDSVCYYSVAVSHLAGLLQSHDLRKCYTHNPDILEHGFNCEGFPIELQQEIVRLWLDFNGDIEPLLVQNKSELMTECLVSILETNSEKLVNRVLEVMIERTCDTNFSVKFGARAWKSLPRALASCSVDTVANLKGLLKFVQGTEPEETSLEIYGESAEVLAKVLTNDEFDDELKLLLVQFVYMLLQISCEHNSPTVVAFCINEVELSKILRDKGFARENFQLSAYCIDLLAYIVECQQRFKVQCDKSGVCMIEPPKMLVLIVRSYFELFRAGVRLLLSLLNCAVAIDLSVSLSGFENTEAAEEILFAWYRRLHQILAKTQPKDWRLYYRCLMVILDFCEKNGFPQVLKGLCDYSGTYELVRSTIHHEYTDSIFFEFVELWLRYSTTYHSANAARANYRRLFKNLSISENDFDEIVKMVTQYRNKFRNSEKNS